MTRKEAEDYIKIWCPYSQVNAIIAALSYTWIPIKTRPLTDKEKEEYADLGYSEDSINSIYDCPLPDDGQEVLVTTRYDEVKTDTFYRDEGCYFETYCDEDDVKAWMSKPEPWKAESESEEKPSFWWKCERCGKLIPYMADFCHECAYKLLGEPPKPFKPPIKNEEKCKNCDKYVKGSDE